MKSNVTEKVKGQVEHLKESYARGKESARELTHTAAATSMEAAHRADDWVHDNSWKLLGIALAAGLLLGFLFSGREQEPDLDRGPR
jgi:ElaB/YqjD/DUF883 family membrane-anchored ribosome-binding protein